MSGRTDIFQEERHSVLEERIRRSPIMHISSTNRHQREIDDGTDPERRILPLESYVQQCFRSHRLPFEFRRSKQLSVSSSNLSEDPHGRVSVLVVERERSEKLPESSHHFVDDGSHERVKEFLSEIVDAELERSESLADEFRSSLQCVDERLHEIAEIREEDGESDGNGENEFGKEISLRLVGSLEECVELLEEDLEKREHLLVQNLESTSTDTPKQRSKEEIVRRRFGGLAGELERCHDEIREMGEESGFVLLRENRDGHKRHLEQPEDDGRVLLVVLSKLR